MPTEAETIKRLRNIYRIINGASAITLVGLIVTFVMMNGQLILGNLLKSKRVPSLSLPEIIIVFILDLIFLVIILLVITVVVLIIESFEHPVSAAKEAGAGTLELIKLGAKLIWGKVTSFFGF
ncbi:unnamed protein product [marine sediment metagenome]|uniref:Uncharacterized protein n=1 Tax=marine sediment metagenome TaxID=412755 RepID=X1KHD2_9ZZZZ